MEMVTSLMNLSLIFFGCRYLSAKYEEFWNRTLDLTSDLKPFGGDLIYQSPARQHKAIVSVTTVLFLVATFCDFSSTATPIDSLISAGAYILPHWVLVIALTQYNFLVSLIREVLKCANDAVKSITFNQSAIGPNLRLLAMLHRKIVTINYLVYDISKVFGYLFLSAVISMICVTSVQLLEAYQFSRRSRISYQDGLYFLYTMIWITMQFSQAMLFLLPNDMVKYEMNIIGLNLCQLDRAPFMKLMVKFSDLILIGKGHLFSGGMIQLDRTILVPITGALTTFVVLMIQYDNGGYRILQID
ncbi:uncharacterized protein LOC119770794 isoform X1 [Culex quinquefasciatus]|uniref:uncharacterized protein LOC119770794 isoform X1 n=1 Tax=Culex quinquefasciatus TaxID=7176 RepID=UPI0018E3DEFF|nr:uncharacterized protein LOC119770794 isoform X1 [Culex quinquefasciatus]